MRIPTTRHSIWPTIYLILLGVLCAFLSWHPLANGDDFWAHAAVGRWIWQHGAVPHQTLFLWGAQPVPWVAHSWLSQLLFSGFMSLAGEGGGPYLAQIYTVVLVGLTYFVLWRLWGRVSPVTTVTALIFAVSIMRGHIRYTPRPELFTGLFLVLLLWVLAKWSRPLSSEQEAGGEGPREAPSRREIVTTGLTFLFLFAAWANFHGGVAVGLAVLFLSAVCDVLQDGFDPRSRWLFTISGLGVLAVNINPYGPAYWGALQEVGGPLFLHIEEWKPLWASPQPEQSTVLIRVVLALVAFVAWRLHPQRRNAHLAWLLLLGVAYMAARRNSLLLGLASLAVMGIYADMLTPQKLMRLVFPVWAERHLSPDGVLVVPPRLVFASRVAVVMALVLALAANPPRKPGSTWSALSPRLATRMASFIQEKYPDARIFNNYEVSSYLQWRFAGHPPLFIDLLNAYPAELFDMHDDMIGAKPEGRRRLEKGDIDLVVLDNTFLPGWLQSYLDASGEWRRVYDADDGVIWARRDASVTAGLQQ